MAALESPGPTVYAAWFFGVRGHRLFQSYGLRYGKLREGRTKGEATIPAGELEVEVEHVLGNQIRVQAHLPEQARVPQDDKGWKPKGTFLGQAWQVERITEKGFVLKLERPAAGAVPFI